MNLRLGRWSRWLTPGISWCARCKTSWQFVTPHVTRYTDGTGCFPLCEKCWAELTPETRLPYYRALWARWIEQGSLKTDRDWVLIERSVKAGM